MAMAGELTLKWVVAEGATLIAPDVPLSVPSVALMVWLAAVRRVALKVPVPPVSVLSGGSVAAVSLLVKWAVPV